MEQENQPKQENKVVKKAANSNQLTSSKVVEYKNVDEVVANTTIGPFRLFPEANQEKENGDGEAEQRNGDGDEDQMNETYMSKQQNTTQVEQAQADFQMVSNQSISSQQSLLQSPLPRPGFQNITGNSQHQIKMNAGCLTSARNRLAMTGYCQGISGNGVSVSESSHSVKMSLLYPGLGTTSQNMLNEDELVQFQKEFRAQQRDHEKKEALYEQKIQLLELEMKDLQERQVNMSRINQKLMTIFEKKSETKSKSKSRTKIRQSDTESIDSSILAKMDKMMHDDQTQLLKVQRQLEESGRKVTKLNTSDIKINTADIENPNVEGVSLRIKNIEDVKQIQIIGSDQQNTRREEIIRNEEQISKNSNDGNIEDPANQNQSANLQDQLFNVEDNQADQDENASFKQYSGDGETQNGSAAARQNGSQMSNQTQSLESNQNCEVENCEIQNQQTEEIEENEEELPIDYNDVQVQTFNNYDNNNEDCGAQEVKRENEQPEPAQQPRIQTSLQGSHKIIYNIPQQQPSNTSSNFTSGAIDNNFIHEQNIEIQRQQQHQQEQFTIPSQFQRHQNEVLMQQQHADPQQPMSYQIHYQQHQDFSPYGYPHQNIYAPQQLSHPTATFEDGASYNEHNQPHLTSQNSGCDGIYSQQMAIQNSSISEQQNNSSCQNQTNNSIIDQMNFAGEQESSIQMVPFQLVQQEIHNITLAHQGQMQAKDNEIFELLKQNMMLQDQCQILSTQRDQGKHTIGNLEHLIEEIIQECNMKTSQFENELRLQKEQLDEENYQNFMKLKKQKDIEENFRNIQENLESQVENLNIQIKEKQASIQDKDAKMAELNENVRKMKREINNMQRYYGTGEVDYKQIHESLDRLEHQTASYMLRDRLSFNDRYEVIILSEYELVELNQELKNIQASLEQQSGSDNKQEENINFPMIYSKSQMLKIDKGQRNPMSNVLNTRSKSSMSLSNLSDLLSKSKRTQAEEIRRLVMQINFLKEQMDVAIYKIKAMKANEMSQIGISNSMRSRQASMEELKSLCSQARQTNIKEQIHNLQQELFASRVEPQQTSHDQKRSHSKDSQINASMIQQLELQEFELQNEIVNIEEALHDLKQFKINQQRNLKLNLNSDLPSSENLKYQQLDQSDDIKLYKQENTSNGNVHSPCHTPLQEAKVNQPKSSIKISDSQAQLQNLFTQRAINLRELQWSRSQMSGGTTRNDEMRKEMSSQQMRKSQSPSCASGQVQEFKVVRKNEDKAHEQLQGKKLMDSHGGPILNKYIKEINKWNMQNSIMNISAVASEFQQENKVAAAQPVDFSSQNNKQEAENENAEQEQNENEDGLVTLKLPLKSAKVLRQQNKQTRSTQQISLQFLKSSESNDMLSTARRSEADVSPKLNQTQRLCQQKVKQEIKESKQEIVGGGLRGSLSWKGFNQLRESIQSAKEKQQGPKHKFQLKRSGSGGGVAAAKKIKGKTKSITNVRSIALGIPQDMKLQPPKSPRNIQANKSKKKESMKVLQNINNDNISNIKNKLNKTDEVGKQHERKQSFSLKQQASKEEKEIRHSKQSYQAFKENKENAKILHLDEQQTEENSMVCMSGGLNRIDLERLPSHQEQIEQVRQRRSRSRFNKTASNFSKNIIEEPQIVQNNTTNYAAKPFHNRIMSQKQMDFANNTEQFQQPMLMDSQSTAYYAPQYGQQDPRYVFTPSQSQMNTSQGSYRRQSLMDSHQFQTQLLHANNQPAPVPGQSAPISGYYQLAHNQQQWNQQPQPPAPPMQQHFEPQYDQQYPQQHQNMGQSYKIPKLQLYQQARNARQTLDSIGDNMENYQQMNPSQMFYTQNMQQHQADDDQEAITSGRLSQGQQSILYHGSTQQYSPSDDIVDVQINPCNYIVNYKGTGSGQLISKASGSLIPTSSVNSVSHSRKSSTITLGGAGGGAFGPHAHVSLLQSAGSKPGTIQGTLQGTAHNSHTKQITPTSHDRGPQVREYNQYQNAQPKQSYYNKVLFHEHDQKSDLFDNKQH